MTNLSNDVTTWLADHACLWSPKYDPHCNCTADELRPAILDGLLSSLQSELCTLAPAKLAARLSVLRDLAALPAETLAARF